MDKENIKNRLQVIDKMNKEALSIYREKMRSIETPTYSLEEKCSSSPLMKIYNWCQKKGPFVFISVFTILSMTGLMVALMLMDGIYRHEEEDHG